MAVPGLFWIELGFGVALIFLTAKAHGRQIRLEREREGYMEVDFMKENPPWVEALWRKDRRRYWVTFVLAIVILTEAGLLTLPTRFGTEPLGNPILGTILLTGLLWPLVVAFTSNGLQSAFRLRTALVQRGRGRKGNDPARPESSAWGRAAFLGSIGYWALTVAIGAAAAVLALT
jgi:hypothetical protein